MDSLIAPAQSPIFREYLRDVSAWHGYVRFLGLPSLQTNPDIPIEELYVPLALSETQLKLDEDPSKWTTMDPVSALVQYKRLVILGDPGAGKSTLINWFAWYLASGFSRRLEGKLDECLPIPFVLRDLDLAKVTNFDSLIDSLLERPVAQALREKKDILYDYIRSGQALLLFDGLDEISYEKRKIIRDVINDGIRRFPNCYYLFTSRIVGYEEVPLDSEDDSSVELEVTQSPNGRTLTKKRLSPQRLDLLDDEDSGRASPSKIIVLYVAPFNNDQVSLFALNWYREQGGPDMEARQLSKSFVNAIRSTATTNQLARTPNLLTMMALIFRVRAQLPDGTALLYEDIAQAYLESIDSARQLKDEFSWIRKKRWLARVGFEMQMQRVAQFSSGTRNTQELLVSRQQVLVWISDAMAQSGDIASSEYSERYLDWIAKRSGLLIPRGEGQFAFSHLSFQEYFCAVYIKQQLENPDWRDPSGDIENVLDERAKRSAIENWATVSSWHQTLIFIFELFAGMPGWPKVLMGIFFAKGWNAPEKFGWTGSSKSIVGFIGNNANTQLRCWLNIICNPHSGLQQSQQDTLFEEGFSLALQQQQRFSSQNDIFYTFTSGGPNIFSHLLMSEKFSEKTLSNLKSNEKIEYLRFSEVDAERFNKVISITRNLTQLSVGGLKNEDLLHISELKKLTDLTLHHCKLDDFRIFENLHSLKKLSLASSSFSNLDGFEKLPKLTSLNIDETNISTLKPLNNQKNLTDLSAERTSIQSLEGLENSKQLTSLMISFTAIEDFSLLSKLNNLVVLFASNTNISDLSFASKTVLVEFLILNGTKIRSLEGIEKCKNLSYLSIGHTSISDLAPISNLKSLKGLMLYQTEVSNLTPIVGLSNLKNIDLDDTKVSSVAELAKISSLEEISIRFTKVRSVRALEKLTLLKDLSIEGTGASATPIAKKLLDLVKFRRQKTGYPESP